MEGNVCVVVCIEREGIQGEKGVPAKPVVAFWRKDSPRIIDLRPLLLMPTDCRTPLSSDVERDWLLGMARLTSTCRRRGVFKTQMMPFVVSFRASNVT